MKLDESLDNQLSSLLKVMDSKLQYNKLVVWLKQLIKMESQKSIQKTLIIF